MHRQSTTTKDLRRADDCPTTFVPMASVDESLGTILRPLVRPFADVKRGFTYFEEGHVLFAKITPCMQNGKQAIATNLIDGIGFGSTEFHVVRCGPSVLPEWVHKYLRQPSLLRAATAHFTGAVGQQRLPEQYLENLDIPLPPLPDQRRIVAILDEQLAAVEKARAATEAQVEAAGALPSAFLRRAFNGEL